MAVPTMRLLLIFIFSELILVALSQEMAGVKDKIVHKHKLLTHPTLNDTLKWGSEMV